MPETERSRISVTAIAQSSVAKILGPGMRAIDATVGNGHDTLFLARKVAPGGRVLGLDVQQAAINATRQRLEAAGLAGTVDLRLAGHQHLAAATPTTWHGSVSVAMFNLGYLPGSNKQVVTRPDTTLPALEDARTVLAPGGLLSVIVYPNHPGGDAEAAAVAQWVAGLSRLWSVRRLPSPGPVLYLISRGR